MIRWQPGYVYPPVFEPPHYQMDPLSAAFFAILVIVAAALTYRRPAMGLGLLIACTPFADARYAFGTSITVPKVVLVGFVVALLLRRTSIAVLRERAVVLFLLAFGGVLVSIVLSGIAALHHDAVARELGKWGVYAVTFAAAAVGFAHDPDDRPVWWALVGLAFFEAGEAFFQLLFGAPSGVFGASHHAIPRVAGSLEGPNQFSGWLDILIPVLFARMLVHRDPWLVAAFVLSAVAEAATLSRSGIVAVFVAIVLVLAVTRPPRQVGFRFAVGAVALIAVLATLGLAVGLESRFFSVAELPQPDHLGTRSILWRSALELWQRSPLVGIGAGNFELDLGMVGFPDVRTHANSLYLQALAETGIFGFVAMLFLVATSITTFARSYSRRPLVIGAFAAGIALALHQVFDYLLFYPKVGAFWGLLLGIAVVELLASRDDAGPVLESQ